MYEWFIWIQLEVKRPRTSKMLIRDTLRRACATCVFLACLDALRVFVFGETGMEYLFDDRVCIYVWNF